MDEQTLEIIPIKTSPEEGDGAASPEKGKRHCIMVVPKGKQLVAKEIL